MRHRPPLEYDISVSADKRRRARQRGMSGAFDASERACEWPGCSAHAAYRAPVSPELLNQYKWFCLDHVREYNTSWNFFAGSSEEEVDAQMRADRTWERPTWSLKDGAGRRPGQSPHAGGNAWARWGFRDAHEVLGEFATRNAANEDPAERRARRLPGEERAALDTLGLGPEVESRAEIRTRYRELVKDLHPDMNGGNRSDEARLARVIRAWDILRASRHFRD